MFGSLSFLSLLRPAAVGVVGSGKGMQAYSKMGKHVFESDRRGS